MILNLSGKWIINKAATIRCYKGSKVDRYCQQSGFKVEYFPNNNKICIEQTKKRNVYE